MLVLDYPLWPELVEANWCINIPPDSDQIFEAFKQGVEGERSDDMQIFGDGKAGVKILDAIVNKFKGGPVGLTTIATAVGEESGTIEEVHEPFLIMEGYIQRTPRGREATEKTFKHLGVVPPGRVGTLFGD